MCKYCRFVLSLPLLWLCLMAASHAQSSFYVATDGVDTPGGGSSTQPWASITYALDRVPDNSLILVRPGLYQGRVRIRGQFEQGVTVRSEQPYRARMRHDAAVFTVYSGPADVYGISLEGFDIAHSGPGAAALVVHVQSGGGAITRDITLRDNIIHDSYNNDLLKINNGARQIRVLGNLFYNQSGSDEHIDINSVDDVLVEGNVFFNDFAASGRPNNNDTSSYIVVKDSNGNDDDYLGARNVQIRRNIFLNWQGSPGHNFVLCGEDGHPWYEAFDILVENNLMLGNSAHGMRAPLGVKGCRDVVFRANSVHGPLPASAFAFRLNTEGSNQINNSIAFYNNIWSSPGGSMNRFSTTPFGETSNWTLNNNLYWNGASTLPFNSNDLINIDNDLSALHADPSLPALGGVQTPWWDADQGQFNGGHARIADVFLSLALNYGMPDADAAGRGQALPGQMPADDLLGRPRGPAPDLGAVQYVNDQIFADGFEGS